MSTTTTTRIHNFSAGPATLPLEVLEEAQQNLLSLPGVGMSILEVSHRSPAFEEILARCEEDLRTLAGVPPAYKVLFLQGGASLQFSMVPMNLLPPNGSADYVVTGAWSEKAVKEAKRVAGVRIAATTAGENYNRVPTQEELKLDPAASYVHMTTNNTIFGTQWHYTPKVGDVPLVADASSDILSGPIDVESFGLIYAGAQKNLGPAGATLVIIREDLLARTPTSIPTMLQYPVHVENSSMYNTPPVFTIYLMGLVLKWLVKAGGLSVMAQRNAAKAEKLYAEIDRTGFYRGHATKDSRSRMNVTFRLPTEGLEKAFAKEAATAGLDGLKGHRSVGGLRASVYNAFPESGVDALVDFMRAFERRNG